MAAESFEAVALRRPAPWPNNCQLERASEPEVESMLSTKDSVRLMCERAFLSNSTFIDWRNLMAFRSTAELLSFIDDVTKDLLVELTACMPGVVNERVIVHEQWPKDWWQAFKERWFPSWLKRHFPVEWNHLDIDRPLYAAVCPHVDITDRTPHLQWLLKHQQ